MVKTLAIVNLFNGSGGGVRVALQMANILSKRGYDVKLFALAGLPINELDRIHGTCLSTYLGKTLSMKYYLKGKVHSYALRLRLFALSQYVKMAKEVITKYRPSLVLLFDDIPPLEWSGVNSHVMIYSHFPYAARLIFNIYDAMDSEYIDAFEILRERIFRIAFLHRYFYTGNIKDFENIKVTANSTITSLYIRKTWGVDSTILYPPIVSPQFIKQNIINNKQNIIVSLGVIMPGKRHGIVIDAFKKVKERLGNAKLIIIGSLVDKKYYDYLLKKIVSNRLKDSVFIFADIDEERKWAILSKAKVLVHAKRFEPFGITVAEAMMFGAIPIVYRGYTSGPWIDIVRKGEYGMGFRTIEELIEKIHYIMNLSKSEFEELQKKVLSRAHTFSINVFENSFIEIIEELLR